MLLALACVSLIIEASSTYVNGEQYDWLTRRQSWGSSRLCPQNHECVLLAACPYIAKIMDNACLMTSRAESLTCGYPGDGQVCCPRFNRVVEVPVPAGQTQNGFRPKKNCGQSAVEGDDYDGIGAHPWVVRVGFRETATGGLKFPCSGSIISKRVILTTAHCALAAENGFKLSSVRVGEYRTDKEIDCGEEFCGLPTQDIGISHAIIHPDYDSSLFRNNIALLVLRANINYTVTAQPVCLLESWSEPGTDGIIVGWGKIAGQRVQPPFQQKLEVPIVNLKRCESVYSATIPLSQDQLCAGGEIGRDACEGFGGSPLLVRHDGIHYQSGILSFGSERCGEEGYPTVYTNVQKHSQWIKANMPVF